MANTGSAETLEQHQHEVCNAFARAAAAMRDAAHTAENFSNWFSRVNNLQNVPVPPMFNGGGQFSFIPNFGGPQQQQQQQQLVSEPTGRKRKAVADPDGKKKRQVRKPKDVNAPKRPPSAYLLFQNEIRKEVQGKHPDMHYSQILGEISRLWHELSPEQRAPYTEATAVSKVLYEQAKANYEAESPTDKPADTAIPKKTKAVAAPVAESKSSAAAKPAPASDSSSESTEPSTSEDDEEEEEEEEEPEPEPEPPRKKSKRESVKVSTPAPTKVDKKKKDKTGEIKKKKKAEA